MATFQVLNITSSWNLKQQNPSLWSTGISLHSPPILPEHKALASSHAGRRGETTMPFPPAGFNACVYFIILELAVVNFYLGKEMGNRKRKSM